MADCWLISEGIFAPKKENAVEITKFRSISFLNVRRNKGELGGIWLDLVNAYGTIPHKLVELTLLRYHLPEKIRELVKH